MILRTLKNRAGRGGGLALLAVLWSYVPGWASDQKVRICQNRLTTPVHGFTREEREAFRNALVYRTPLTERQSQWALRELRELRERVILGQEAIYRVDTRPSHGGGGWSDFDLSLNELEVVLNSVDSGSNAGLESKHLTENVEVYLVHRLFRIKNPDPARTDYGEPLEIPKAGQTGWDLMGYLARKFNMKPKIMHGNAVVALRTDPATEPIIFALDEELTTETFDRVFAAALAGRRHCTEAARPYVAAGVTSYRDLAYLLLETFGWEHVRLTSHEAELFTHPRTGRHIVLPRYGGVISQDPLDDNERVGIFWAVSGRRDFVAPESPLYFRWSETASDLREPAH